MNFQLLDGADASDMPTSTLILVFVHGFKGTEQSFAEFPKRLQHILSETLPNTSVDSVVFPAYEVHHDLPFLQRSYKFPYRPKATLWVLDPSQCHQPSSRLSQNEAVLRFADWLTTLTVEREVSSGGGSGSVKLVLCGHRSVTHAPSMLVFLAHATHGGSMGGLLIADTLLEFNSHRVGASSPFWPEIIACIGFDTPVGLV